MTSELKPSKSQFNKLKSGTKKLFSSNFKSMIKCDW